MSRLVLACALAILLPRAAFADDPAPEAPPAEPAPAPGSTTTEPANPSEDARPVRAMPSREIRIDVPGERSRNQKLAVGGLFAAGLLGGALGLYFHLDSRDAANEVSAGEITGEAWTQRHVDLVDRAERSRTRAAIAYSIGGAFLIGAIVSYLVTDPKSETAVIRTGVAVTPTEHGGTVVSRMWSF